MVYAIDFDGYLCKNAWPGIGEPNTAIIEHFIKLKDEGHELILWTCREGELLELAIAWCARKGLFFDAVNESLPAWIKKFGTTPRKIGADYYCDDKNYWLMPEKEA